MKKMLIASGLVAGLVIVPGCVGQPLTPFVAGDVQVVAVAPPPLPDYAQPVIAGPGYLWMPGCWAWDGSYYWVPGAWVLPPQPDLLWTPGWWGWVGSGYRWHEGYWGPVVGFYGGIDYGYGYFGRGYDGGYWHDGAFYYNRAVNNVNITNIRNVYEDRTVIREGPRRHASYNGGSGGTTARPTEAPVVQHRMSATAEQLRLRQAAAHQPAQRVSAGRPAVLATPRPEHFTHPAELQAPAPAASGRAPLQGQPERDDNRLGSHGNAPQPQSRPPAASGQHGPGAVAPMPLRQELLRPEQREEGARGAHGQEAIRPEPRLMPERAHEQMRPPGVEREHRTTVPRETQPDRR